MAQRIGFNKLHMFEFHTFLEEMIKQMTSVTFAAYEIAHTYYPLDSLEFKYIEQAVKYGLHLISRFIDMKSQFNAICTARLNAGNINEYDFQTCDSFYIESKLSQHILDSTLSTMTLFLDTFKNRDLMTFIMINKNNV